VPLRPGWFWHPEQKEKTKTPEQLFQLYLKSVGRGAALDLGIAPDTRGLIDAEDEKALAGFGELVSKSFSNNLIATAKLKATGSRGKDFPINNLIDGNLNSYWASIDDMHLPVIEASWNKPQTFDLIRLREFIPLGQRIESFDIEALVSGQWFKVGQATSVGACRIVMLEKPVTADGVRIKVTASPVAVTFSEIGVYKSALQSK
jgi:alpha-L-fucosidase